MTTQKTTRIGTLAVRRSILINAPPERVWREFETFEKLAAWFGRGHRLLEYEPRQNGKMLLEVDLDGTSHRYGGPIIVFNPPHELTFEDDWVPPKWPTPTQITFRLTPALDGTLVELFHHMIENTGLDRDEWHAGFERGWDMKHLIALKQIIEGREHVAH